MYSPINLFTIEEYLELEKSSETRHEYLGGQIFAMSGGSKEHNIITLNIASRIRSHLRGNSCSVNSSNHQLTNLATPVMDCGTMF
jgi:Uma2 family endonuclease